MREGAAAGPLHGIAHFFGRGGLEAEAQAVLEILGVAVAGRFPEAGHRGNADAQLVGHFLLGHVEDAELILLNKIGNHPLVRGKGTAVPVLVHRQLSSWDDDASPL
ncbi:hypothetical protein D3C80_1298310 [compost metagenome]